MIPPYNTADRVIFIIIIMLVPAGAGAGADGTNIANTAPANPLPSTVSHSSLVLVLVLQ